MQPDAYLEDGTPLYFKLARGNGKSLRQLELYQELLEKTGPNPKLVMVKNHGRTEAMQRFEEFKQVYTANSETSRAITMQDIIDACNQLKDTHYESGPYHFYTGGTGIPDEMAVEYYKDMNIIIHARDGKTWQYGKEI